MEEDEKEEERIDRLQGSFLSSDDLELLKTLWVEKGAGNWHRRQKKTGQLWRKQFVERLKNEKNKWKALNEEEKEKALIHREATQPSSLDLEYIDYWLEEASGDPLTFLNLVGVSPWRVLAALEHVDDTRQISGHQKNRFRSERYRQPDAKKLETAAQVLSYNRAELEEPGNYIDCDYIIMKLRRMARRLQKPREKGRVPPWMEGKKGALPKEELCRLVFSLVGIYESSMKLHDPSHSSKSKEEIGTERDKISAGRKAKWGAITAILLTAFPEWFRGDRNHVRNVKNANKQAKKLASLWAEFEP